MHLAQTLLLELMVADSKHLIYDEDVAFEMRGDREGESHIHAGAVSLHRQIKEPLHPRKRDDLIEFALDVRPAHPEDGAIEEDIFATGKLGVKASSDFQQACDPPAEQNSALGSVQ